MPRIGDKAPDFGALTTTGKIKFSDYLKDSWTIMFSHPVDFTPVCTTEMSGFALEKDYFDKHGAKLIGLSIDSIHSHLAWVNNVRDNTSVYMDFPIIADIDMKVSKLYGLLHPGESASAAVRAVFFIDPLIPRVRSLIMYYPLNVGRNMDDIKRVLVALQTADKNGCALPLNWEPGEKVIVPPPQSLEQMDAVLANENLEKVDFYLARRNLN